MIELIEKTRPNKTSELMLDVTITYLEMHQRPIIGQSCSYAVEHISVLELYQPTMSFYRYLYYHVGEPWRWYKRRLLNDNNLRSIIHNPEVSIYVLYFHGSPAGYFELDGRLKNEIELAYFGLLPDFIGRGLGPKLLNWALKSAWNQGPNRVWVHTCTLDHPKAIHCYRQAGFKTYREETIKIRDPWSEPYWRVGLPSRSENLPPDNLA